MNHPTASVLAACALMAGCANDMTGILAADRTGNLLDPPAMRVDPRARIREACGEPGEPGGALLRLPYVQSITEGSAHIVWTTEGEGLETLSIRRADGDPTTIVPDVVATRYLVGARQLDAHAEALEPSTIYCYELVDDGGGRVFGPSGFRTAPPVGSTERVEFAIFGDSGSGSTDQQAVIDQLGTVPIDFVLHVGDLAYPNGTLDEFEAVYFQMYEPLSPSVPFFTAIGDHDDATDHAGPYREVFALPANGGEAASERWYSFDWGCVHVLVLDAMIGGPAQMEFVERDLSSSTQPWRIVVLPVPMYSSGYHGSYRDFRNVFEPIFQRHHVQLVVSGDDHHYERSRPIGGVTYIVTGGGGRSVRATGSSWWTELAVTAFHFVSVSADGEALRIHAIDATGREFDGVEIRP